MLNFDESTVAAKPAAASHNAALCRSDLGANICSDVYTFMLNPPPNAKRTTNKSFRDWIPEPRGLHAQKVPVNKKTHI